MSQQPASVNRLSKAKLTQDCQRHLDQLVAAKGTRGTAKHLGIGNDSTIDKLAYGGSGSPDLVAKVEAAIQAAVASEVRP